MKINIVKTENMTTRNGNIAKNQFLIYAKKGVFFQSYNTTIAYKDLKSGAVYLDKNKWNYSHTTAKYRNQFLDEGIQETRLKIESKEYKLINLNK